MTQIHGTCIEIDGCGILLRGTSGSGKSDLALRLIDTGAYLIADDRVELRADNGIVRAFAPKEIIGLLEIRGLGLFETKYHMETALRLVVDLMSGVEVERLPMARTCTLEGVCIPFVILAPFEESAVAKVRFIAQTLNGHNLCRAGSLCHE